MHAIALTAFVPNAIMVCDGVKWLQFSMDTTSYDEFKAWPRVLEYDGLTFQKMSWNSDRHSITYKHVAKVAKAYEG